MVGRRIIALAADLETAQPWLDRAGAEGYPLANGTEGSNSASSTGASVQQCHSCDCRDGASQISAEHPSAAIGP